MPFHTIVVEVPDYQHDWPTEDRATRALKEVGLKVVEYHREKMTEDVSPEPTALRWESANNDEPLDQNAWVEGGVWCIGPDDRDGFSVEFIAKNDDGDEVLEDGVVLDNQPDEQAAKAAAQAYQDGAR